MMIPANDNTEAATAAATTATVQSGWPQLERHEFIAFACDIIKTKDDKSKYEQPATSVFNYQNFAYLVGGQIER